MARLRFRGRAIGLPHRLQPLATELYMDTRIEPEDCLQAAIDAAGGNKIVGAKLRPEMNPIEAGKWRARCLDPAPKQRLKSAQERLVYALACREGAQERQAVVWGKSGYVGV